MEGYYPPIYPTNRGLYVSVKMTEDETWAKVGKTRAFRARSRSYGGWLLESQYADFDGGVWYKLGSHAGGPIGHYPDRGTAELALWNNVTGSLGVLLGFFGDGGG
jgi:hypothetical protein